MSPQYFLRELTFEEGYDYLVGMERRSRAGWYQARLIADVVCKVLTGKHMDLRYPWEDEENSAESVSEEDWAEMQRILQEENEKIRESRNRESQ